MIIVGERLNSSRRSVLEALNCKDKKYVIDQAKKQENAGASYIDLNTAALLDKEMQTLKWAIPLLQKELRIPLSIDTPNPEAMEAGLKIHKGQALLNSLSGEVNRIKTFLPLIKEFNPRIIVLCLDDEGLPETSDKELSIARKMVNLLEKEGVEHKDIFIDPLVRPIGVDQRAGGLFLEALEKIKKNLPSVNTIAGVSNVSFGLPRRKSLNRAFLVLSLQRGLDAAILDPLDSDILAALRSAEALLGKDPFLRDYLTFIRSSKR
ncbi:MAG: dihydropteroate synthase [Candidatus Aminicenantes bacterium]|nr:MAG: dihydropteroate synthase [Candidatus Aminicenantes bacterium]